MEGPDGDVSHREATQAGEDVSIDCYDPPTITSSFDGLSRLRVFIGGLEDAGLSGGRHASWDR